jgi:hypothetical protein
VIGLFWFPLVQVRILAAMKNNVTSKLRGLTAIPEFSFEVFPVLAQNVSLRKIGIGDIINRIRKK